MAPEFPDEAGSLWEAFSCLPVISASELDGYARITGIEFSVWEVKALFLLNRLRNHG